MIAADSLERLAAGLDAHSLAGKVPLHVALNVVLLLLLLLTFVRACRRGVMFFFLSSVMFRCDSLNSKQKTHLLALDNL